MAFLIIIAIIIVICIVSCSKGKRQVSSKEEIELTSDVPNDYMPENPQNYTFDCGGRRLVRYNGNEDVLCVPLGTSIIGNDEEEIKSNKKWDMVYIPRSVIKINDLALIFVESVSYEGSAEEFNQIRCDFNCNFRPGFIPNWAENLPNPENCRVEQVRFHYNVDIPAIYKLSAEQRKSKDTN